jgi:hypothetical protein
VESLCAQARLEGWRRFLFIASVAAFISAFCEYRFRNSPECRCAEIVAVGPIVEAIVAKGRNRTTCDHSCRAVAFKIGTRKADKNIRALVNSLIIALHSDIVEGYCPAAAPESGKPAIVAL